MSYAPFVLKVAFYAPTRQNQQRNANHIRYIATRPGADRGELEPERIDPGTAAGHIKYAGERPGSHGLFSQDEDHPDLKAVQKELLQHKGVVWRAVLSLREDDAVRLGYTTRKAWETMLRATVAEAAAKMGIREDNLRWVAAFHAVQGHPHVHLVWWEKNSARTRGMLSEGEKKDLRRVFVRQIYAEERTRLLAEKTAIRELLRETARQDVLTLVREIRQARLEVRALAGQEPGIAPELNPIVEQELAAKLKKLASLMPGHGRVALAFMPEEVKKETREIADWILRQPGFNQSLARYRDLARQIASYHTTKPEALEEAAHKAYEDVRDRIAQEVLKGAALINQLERQHTKPGRAHHEQVRIAHSVWKAAWRALERERTRAEAQALLLAERDLERRKRREREEARERA
ncbi:MAG: relaxase MobL [Thermanaeromonas sp.]|uniref:MobP3 family relaxase n=1 Tax=Thermanaeromonas sp. TaxID=2003697 RepID=UPI00243CCF66|nr:MobP3 family relaxase [Thermanaeromonas sp.]MCG0278981.1 relaxase MobL [Thermanaeromonas sp.]